MLVSSCPNKRIVQQTVSVKVLNFRTQFADEALEKFKISLVISTVKNVPPLGLEAEPENLIR